ncbi:MAG: DUF3098 domain-containing protein [Muribaculaceae bacterium]|nr:DUF3098 domain-containing protein [Muribaculaceae bacterium]
MLKDKETKSAFDKTGNFPLERPNFIAMAISGALIVLGFVLMLGGSSTVSEFNPDIFSTRRIVVGPCIAFIGFVAMAAAIIIDPARLTFGKRK